MKEIELLDNQIEASILFIISIIISILLTYDEKLKKLKRKSILSNNMAKYLNLYNRILAIVIISVILYINYQNYQLKKKKVSNLKPFKQQIYASILNLLSAIIVLYVVIETWNTNNIADIENPD